METLNFLNFDFTSRNFWYFDVEQITSIRDHALGGRWCSGRLVRTGLCRSVSAAFFVKLISALLLTPVVVSMVSAVNMLSDGAEGGELFAAVNLIALSIALGLYWISVRIGLTAVPLLLWRKKELSAFSTVIFALKFMRHRRSMPFKLMLAYLPLTLTVVGAPYFIPQWAASYAVGISIFFKEDETAHERACIHGGYGKSTAA